MGETFNQCLDAVAWVAQTHTVWLWSRAWGRPVIHSVADWVVILAPIALPVSASLQLGGRTLKPNKNHVLSFG